MHVYVPDVTTLVGEAAVFRDLDQGHAPRPEHSTIIRSRGAAGLLMRFTRPNCISDVLLALTKPPGLSSVCLLLSVCVAYPILGFVTCSVDAQRCNVCMLLPVVMT